MFILGVERSGHAFRRRTIVQLEQNQFGPCFSMPETLGHLEQVGQQAGHRKWRRRPWPKIGSPTARKARAEFIESLSGGDISAFEMHPLHGLILADENHKGLPV